MKSVRLTQDELINLVGKIKAAELLNPRRNVTLTRKELKRVMVELRDQGVCTLTVAKNSGKVRFVSPKYVTIAPRYRLEKKKKKKLNPTTEVK